MALTACGLMRPFSASDIGTSTPSTPRRSASSPAGAFQTPRLPSMRAMIPAIVPLGSMNRGLPSGLICKRGQ